MVPPLALRQGEGAKGAFLTMKHTNMTTSIVCLSRFAQGQLPHDTSTTPRLFRTRPTRKRTYGFWTDWITGSTSLCLPLPMSAYYPTHDRALAVPSDPRKRHRWFTCCLHVAPASPQPG